MLLLAPVIEAMQFSGVSVARGQLLTQEPELKESLDQPYRWHHTVAALRALSGWSTPLSSPKTTPLLGLSVMI